MTAKVQIKQVVEKTNGKLNEDIIISHVQKYGRLISPRKGLYGVSFNGKAYLKPDTRDLVVAICKDNKIKVNP